MKEKICHLSCGHPLYDTRILRKECVSLAEAGYRVTLVAVGEEESVFQGVRLIGIPAARSFLGRVTFDLLTRTSWRIVRIALAEKADVYHFHDPHLMPVGVFLRVLGKRVIYDVHEYEAGRISAKLPHRVRRIAEKTLYACHKLIARCFSGVVTATPFISKQFSGTSSHVVVVNNYPKMEEFGEIAGEPFAHRRSQVCYVGFMADNRGIVEMIAALEGSSVTLALGGGFNRAELREKCKGCAGWQHVVELGQITRETMSHVLSESIAGIVLFLPHPNHFDSQPNKIFEYMAAGLPVVATNFPLWREFVEENGAGICVDPSSPGQIRAAYAYLEANRSIAEEMGRRGREAVKQRYNWAVEEQKLLCFYRELLDKVPGRAGLRQEVVQR